MRIGALGRGERPDAVFAVNDIMAMGLMDALRQAGLDVPGDMSVVGFDDIGPSARAIYNLTIVAQPVSVMLRRGLDLLAGRIADPGLPYETAVPRG
ncbi:substrate-binding domain-containing protein [Teichococcus oryzae]|uniref:Transcriptional regulator LacI/GalR-like sensor domain-containing protein n=1 Tax=Teichococcus oryzae TaxID=1608942 RepID=A0A5B2TDM6_9PROT|nr:substrate-binding domain-containing protein [Pseudoroseomonas oryzae]KAA2212203.1 hypothetical protein F0Q34_16315 [Pseudoroseomonas oryzae]